MGKFGDMIRGNFGAIANVGMGLFQGNINNNRLRDNTRDFMDWQLANSKELTEFNREQQMQMWRDTNYAAQREQMEKAGLNVGLMYGGGGQGGSTNVSTAQTQGADGHSAMPPMDIANALAQGQQVKNMQAQEELTRAQIEKTKAETNETTARTPTYEKGMQKTDAEIKEIATKIGVNETSVRKMFQEIEESGSRTNLNQANIIKTETEVDRLKKITPEEVENIQADTKKKIGELAQGWKKLSLDEQRVKIEQFKEEIKAKYPSIGQTGGRILNSTIEMWLDIFGLGEIDDEKQSKVK